MKTGDVVGRVGNSGASDFAHLHLHVTDDETMLGGDGVPHVHTAFTVEGNVGSTEALLEGRDITRKPERVPDRRLRELPENRDVVRFE
jgi:murein DD-endopeptidase MepM/ murein hydrolase activator NlpD